MLETWCMHEAEASSACFDSIFVGTRWLGHKLCESSSFQALPLRQTPCRRQLLQQTWPPPPATLRSRAPQRAPAAARGPTPAALARSWGLLLPMRSSPHDVCGVQSRCCRRVAAAPAVHACPGTATRREPARARLPAQRTLCLPGSGLAAQGIQCMRPGANVEPCCAGCNLQECSCSGRTNSTDGERVC